MRSFVELDLARCRPSVPLWAGRRPPRNLNAAVQRSVSLLVEMGGKGARMRSRTVPLVVALMLAVTLVGCSDSSTEPDTSEPAATQPPSTTTTTDAPTTTTEAPTTTTTTTTQPADRIHGTWFWARYSAYEDLAEDGTWGVWFTADLAGHPHDWGTYTFDGETLVYTNAEYSWCPGSVATWTVEFSDDGQESRQTFVEDTCTRAGTDRGKDRVLVRQTP